MKFETPYMQDLLAQPAALNSILEGFNPAQLKDLVRDLSNGRFERVVITGMGASYFGTYPAWLTLVRAGLPAFWVETGELLFQHSNLINERTLLWIVSNSGKSTEIRRLLKRLPELGSPFLLSNTNDNESPLARGASLNIPLYTGSDLTVSSRSYLGTLAVCQMIALTLTGGAIDQARSDFRATGEGIAAYLEKIEDHLKVIEAQAAGIEQLYLVGRGSSYASALEGSLLLKEAARGRVEGLSIGQFWHGPVELADAHLTVIAFEGEGPASVEDREVLPKLVDMGAHLFWVGHTPPPGAVSLPMPACSGFGLPLAEILPVQLLAVPLARQCGIQPGVFRYLLGIVDTRSE